MLDQLQKMFATPQAREMLFRMMAQQVANAPAERREALGRVTVTIERTKGGFRLGVDPCDDPQIEGVIRGGIDAWADMLARGFQSMGFRVEIVE